MTAFLEARLEHALALAILFVVLVSRRGYRQKRRHDRRKVKEARSQPPPREPQKETKPPNPFGDPD